jgi:ubiquinone/menaquinone biosynthesis C-methylase UbiE
MSGWEKRYWNKRARCCGVSAPGLSGGTAHDQKAIDAFEKVADCNILLDVGCGTGRLYETLTKHCQKYVGIDFSAEMLKLFREHRTLRPQDELFLIDIADGLPFPDKSFDVIVSNVVLQHIVDDGKFRKAVMEIKRVLKTRGACYICECTTPGVLAKQPFPHQYLRPTAIIHNLFMPEIDLQDQGEIQSIQHFFYGRKVMSAEFATLNIGCGVDKRGHVRVDVNRYDQYFKMKTAVNIIASAEALPFMDTVFNDVIVHHVIEHLNNPLLAIKEAARVGGHCSIIYPNDRTGALIEALETVKILLTRSRELTKPKKQVLLLHLQKLSHWKERHVGKQGWAGHKWTIHFPNENKIYYYWPMETGFLRGPLKIVTAYGMTTGKTWMNKAEITVSASIICRGKEQLTLYAPAEPDEATEFADFLTQWVHKAKRRRGEK